MGQELRDVAWALLRMLYRRAPGGVRPPAGALSHEAYRELERGGLVEDGELTSPGTAFINSRYPGSQAWIGDGWVRAGVPPSGSRALPRASLESRPPGFDPSRLAGACAPCALRLPGGA